MFILMTENLHANAQGDNPIPGRAKQLARLRRHIYEPPQADVVDFAVQALAAP